MDYLKEALDKLAAGVKVKQDRYGEVMKSSVHDALAEFCRQDGEFAQAVAQGGKFEDCMKAVSKCVKNNAITDAEAWGAAVRFYFPGAKIRVSMEIDLCGSVRAEGERDLPQSGPGLIDLSEFF